MNSSSFRIFLKDLGFAKFYLNKEHNILEIEYQANSIIRKEEVFKVLSARSELVQGKQVLVLIEVTKEFINFTEEARSTFVSEQKKDSTAIKMAFLINGLADRIVANFYIRFDHPIVPTRIFNNRKKAIEWLTE